MSHFITPVNLSDSTALNTQLEHRRVFSLKNFELNIYETFVKSHQVELSYNGLVITSMMRGRKILYHQNEPNSFDFLPGTTMVIPEGIKMKADFPDADKKNPVQCANLSLDWHVVLKTIEFINENYPKADGSDWKLDFSQYHFKNNRNLALSLNRLISLSMEDCEGKDALADLLLKSLLIRVMQNQEQVLLLNQMEQPDVLRQLDYYISNHIGTDISLEELYKVANCSRSSFYRLIKEHYDVSPTEFLQNTRIRFAKGILSQPGTSVSEACYKSGFNSLSYFSKVFKKATGKTPTDFSDTIIFD